MNKVWKWIVANVTIHQHRSCSAITCSIQSNDFICNFSKRTSLYSNWLELCHWFLHVWYQNKEDIHLELSYRFLQVWYQNKEDIHLLSFMPVICLLWSISVNIWLLYCVCPGTFFAQCTLRPTIQIVFQIFSEIAQVVWIQTAKVLSVYKYRTSITLSHRGIDTHFCKNWPLFVYNNETIWA